MFRIQKVIIHPGCIGRNNLEEEVYSFVSDDWEKLPEDFYGKNIIVSAIVGKNGSGKSSLLDIIYRVLNNLCAVMCTNLNTDTHFAFGYIGDLKAEIHYKDSANRDCSIKCIGNTLRITYHDKWGNPQTQTFGGKNNSFPDTVCENPSTARFRAAFLNELFYCSVVNYAPFTLNAHDYARENCLCVEEGMLPSKQPRYRINWVQSIFHKNDGYQSNITLTPYRDYGKFDAEREFKLAKERILSILASYPKFIEGYRLKKAVFRFNQGRFTEKFLLTNPSRENGYKPKMKIQEFVDEFIKLLSDYKDYNRRSIASVILYHLGIRKRDLVVEGTDSEPYIYAYLYLVYKVLNCAGYPIFEEYKELNNPDLAISGNNSKKLLLKVIMLTKAVMAEHSHITFKIERTLYFIKNLSKLRDSSSCGEFTLQHYLMASDQGLIIDGLIPTISHLPPSYFDLDIYLEPEEDRKPEILLEKLSSGEKLFYITICSVIYHAMNILSIPERDDRVKYKNMLVVLDETEICFHPDYQRTFIKRLLDTIKRLEFNKDMNLHILMTTHSPFILSDIPTSNILYLSDGKVIKSQDNIFINPFSANINDILAQSFFLSEDGFIGEAAREIVLSLYSYLENVKKRQKSPKESLEASELLDVKTREILWDKESAKYAIEQIGEPLIRNSLREIYASCFGDTEYLRRQIEELQARLREMEERRKDEKDINN